VAWIPPRFPPAGQRQIMSTNTCFIHHWPNQSEHHSSLPKFFLIYPKIFKRVVLIQEFYMGQPSPCPCLGLGQRQIMCTNTCFIHHCPNQSEHHATLPKIIINYPSIFKRGVLECSFTTRMPFVSQRGLGTVQCTIAQPSTHSAPLCGS
jgi:hypothetical protein